MVIVSEIMYHPGAPSAEESAAQHVSSDDFEYLEVTNISDATVDLAGAMFDAGIRYHLVKPITFQELKNTLRLAL